MNNVFFPSFEHAQELMIEGKRDLLIHAIPDAVSNFSEACELMVKHKGETAIESAEAYLYYGRALLELSRVDATSLGTLVAHSHASFLLLHFSTTTTKKLI